MSDQVVVQLKTGGNNKVNDNDFCRRFCWLIKQLGRDISPENFMQDSLVLYYIYTP